MNIRHSLGVVVAALLLTACSDGVSGRILLTDLVDNIFMAEENSEPENIDQFVIIDDADENSFTYLIESR